MFGSTHEPNRAQLGHGHTGLRDASLPIQPQSARDNLLTGDQHGFLAQESSNDNEVKGNRISHGGSIEIGHSRDNRVEGNVLTDPGDGILLFEANARLSAATQ